MKNFFDDATFQEEIKRATAKARDHLNSIQPATSIHSGDCFLFTESLDLPVRWVATLQHKDSSDLWYFVAADDFPLVGSCDIELPESDPSSPMVIRCEVGLWVRSEDVDRDKYLGRIDAEIVSQAKERLSQMVHGDVIVTESASIAEADPDYVEWIQELSRVAELAEARIQAEPVVLRFSSFGTAWENLSLVAERRAEYTTLAADALGLVPSSKTPLGCKLPSMLPGELVVQRDGDELDVMYFPSVNGDVPPSLKPTKREDIKDGKWVMGAEGAWTWSEALLFTDGNVAFSIGAEKFEVRL